VYFASEGAPPSNIREEHVSTNAHNITRELRAVRMKLACVSRQLDEDTRQEERRAVHATYRRIAHIMECQASLASEAGREAMDVEGALQAAHRLISRLDEDAIIDT